MVYLPESTLIDTMDGFQCKTYANEHPEGYFIVKPKYLPEKAVGGEGLKYRFLFEKCLVRFNLFAKKEALKKNLEQFRQNYPDYFYQSPLHQNWFFVVPKNRIKQIHDGRQGLQELMKIPLSDLDPYLTLVRGLINFLTESGVNSCDLGITHSTLLGNYTFGKSDIDLIIYGKKKGWQILDYLKTASHPLLKWKSEAEWREYYQVHKTSESTYFTENEYVRHMARKKYEGTFGGTVFTLFTVEEPEEVWCPWGEEKYQPLGLATVEGIVTDHYHSLVRPGYYEIKEGKIIEGVKNKENWPIQRIVTYSIPFVQQAVQGEKIKACGWLELVTPKQGQKYCRVVIGYFDAYVTDRREKEYIKSEVTG